MLGMCSSFHISHALHSKEQVGGGGQRFSICSLLGSEDIKKSGGCPLSCAHTLSLGRI